MRIERAHEGSVVVHAGDDGLVGLADVRVQDDGGDALLHLALDLARGVFHLGASLRDGVELHLRSRAARDVREPCLEQALRDHVREAAVGRGGVGVVLHGEAEVAGRWLIGLDQHVFAGPHQLDHGQREIGKVIGILLLLRRAGNR